MNKPRIGFTRSFQQQYYKIVKPTHSILTNYILLYHPLVIVLFLIVFPSGMMQYNMKFKSKPKQKKNIKTIFLIALVWPQTQQ